MSSVRWASMCIAAAVTEPFPSASPEGIAALTSMLVRITHSTVLKIVLTGCDSSDFNIKVPASAALPSFICPGQEIFEEQFFHRTPERFVLLSGKEVLRDNCVLRV